MRIGYFVGRFPYPNPVPGYYEFGGGEIAAYGLAVSMSKRGHDIHIFTTSLNHRESTENREGLIIHRFGIIPKQILGPSISFSLIFKPLKYDLDIAHVHTGSSPIELIAALLYAKIRKKPLIVTYHGDVFPSLHEFIIYRGGVRVYNLIAKRLLDYADLIISPSQCYKNESIFLRKYNTKVIAIPNGINLEDFDSPSSKEECRKELGLAINKKIILFVGFLHLRKGPDVLLKAMAVITNEVPDAELIIAGEGPMRKELEKLAEDLGIANRVKFVGFVGEGLKSLYFKSADIFVLPSTMITESFGIVNLEAMACGVPIVASKIGGIPDVVKDKENGLLIPPKNPTALAEAIIYLLKNEEMRRKMGEKGKEMVKNYSWNKVAAEYEEVYKTVLNLNAQHSVYDA